VSYKNTFKEDLFCVFNDQLDHRSWVQ